MDPAQIIANLMRQSPDPLTILPNPASIRPWIEQDHFILQMVHPASCVGYVLYEHVNDQRTTYVNHASLDLNGRHRLFAANVVSRLAKRAATANSTSVLFGGALDLKTLEFWKGCGFVPTAAAPASGNQQKILVQLEKRLPPRQQKLAGRTLRDSARPNA